MIRRWGALLLLSVVGLAAAGCGKQVNIVFVNQTPYTMPLELQPPGGQRDFVGLLEPRGGAVKTKVPVGTIDIELKEYYPGTPLAPKVFEGE